MDDEQAKSNDQSPTAPFSSSEQTGSSSEQTGSSSEQTGSSSEQTGSSSEQTGSSDQAATPWDDLARTLGAEPSPETLERPRLETAPPHHEPTISSEPPLPESTETPTLQHSDSQTGDWAGLAAELGVTIDDSPEPATHAPANAGGDEDASLSSQPQSTVVPLEEDSREETPAEAWGALPSFQEEEPSQVTFTEEPILPEDELDKEDEPDETDSPVEKGLSGEVARSVFDALFLSGTAAAEALGNLLPSRESDARKRESMSTDQRTDPEQSESEQDESGQPEQGIEEQDALPPRERTEKSASRRGTGRRRGRRRRGRDGESEKDTQGQLEEPRDDALEERELSSEEGDEESHKSNARRRPRRRRGRGRGVATRETDDPTTSPEKELSSTPGSERAASGHETDDSTSEWKEAAPRDHRNQQALQASEDVDQKNVTEKNVTEENVTGKDDLDEEGKSDSHRGSSSKRPSHRNIPTWEEAMSVIVDSNIESRKNSPTPTGRSGSSRSRGRGGRRRKKT